MHKGWIIGHALLALAVSGCSQAEGGPSAAPTPTPPLIKGIYAFRDCKPTDIKATIRIIIPNNIQGVRIGRNVKIKNERGESENDNVPAAEEPFDVFLKGAGLPTTGYAKVKVVIKNNDKWRFYVSTDPKDPTKSFYGIGSNDQKDVALCGRNPLEPPTQLDAADDKEIAIFYVDLKAMAGKPETYVAPFTIGLVSGTEGSKIQTPILIDPKIRNDGGR
jgi:hypothetical protein